MSPALAGVAKQQLPDLQRLIVGFGAIKSVTFKGVGPGGADIYDVAFGKGATQWRIIVGTDGTFETIGLRVLP
jgi:hypothetical protein